MTWPLSFSTASPILAFSRMSTYAKAGETPATRSRIRRTEFTWIPADSTQSFNSDSVQLYGTFIIKRVDTVGVPPGGVVFFESKTETGVAQHPELTEISVG